MPVSRPLITRPTMRPRAWSGARLAAKGTRIWATTEVAPLTSEAISSVGKLVARPAATRARGVTVSSAVTRLRFSSRSPSGTRKSMPIT
jgi:hypothetical protein